MSTSVKHHFIPQFYLKRFTDETGRFYIYKVKEDRFVRNGKLFYPSEYFFEKNSNTVELDGGRPDFIEFEYSHLDSEIAAIIEKVDKGSQSLTLHEWEKIQYFIVLMYWRSPYNFSHVQSYVKNANSNQLGINISCNRKYQQAVHEAQDAWSETLKHDINFLKFMKLSLPAVTHDEVFNTQGPDYSRIVEFPDSQNLPKLVSDNPIINRRPGVESLHRDAFIFKMTHDKVIFRHNHVNPEVKSRMRLVIDILYLMQAHNYVACTEMGYVRKLRNEFEKFGMTVEELRKEVFDSMPADRMITALTLGDLLG